jgi:hypothetical protein
MWRSICLPLLLKTIFVGLFNADQPSQHTHGPSSLVHATAITRAPRRGRTPHSDGGGLRSTAKSVRHGRTRTNTGAAVQTPLGSCVRVGLQGHGYPSFSGAGSTCGAACEHSSSACVWPRATSATLSALSRCQAPSTAFGRCWLPACQRPAHHHRAQGGRGGLVKNSM